jgi:HK97 family phage portal protein
MGAIRRSLIQWLAKSETKALGGSRIAMHTVSGADVGNMTYKQVAAEGYAKSSDIYSALNHYAHALGGVPWVVRTRTKGKRRSQWDILDEHPFYDLWERPNPLYTQSEWIQRFIMYHWLAGEVFVLNTGPVNAAPQEMWLLRPDFVTIKRGDSFNPIEKFLYRPDPNKDPIPYEPIVEERGRITGQCWYTAFASPLDELRGMSPFVPAALGINIGTSGRAMNWQFMRNGARPSGMLITPTELTPEQKSEIEREFSGKHGGESNAGKPIFAYGVDDNGKSVVQWIETGMSPKDLDWAAGITLSTADVSRVTRIPPPKLGDYTHSIYSNVEAADRQMWTDAILPYADMLRDALQVFVMPFYGPDVYLDYDKTQIEALAEDQQQLWERAKSTWFISMNEARGMVGLEALKGDEGRVFMIPSGMVPTLPEDLVIDFDELPPEEPPREDNTDDDTDEEEEAADADTDAE